VRRVRDDIERRVRELLAELHALPPEEAGEAGVDPDVENGEG
jgi:hypothetical protein